MALSMKSNFMVSPFFFKTTSHIVMARRTLFLLPSEIVLLWSVEVKSEVEVVHEKFQFGV